MEVFEQANRPDLAAKCVNRLERTLHRLERWEELEAVVQRTLPLQQTYGHLSNQAQDYGFLADIALHRQQWRTAADLAQQALETVAQLPEPTWWRMLYLKMWAEADQGLGETDAATAAQSMGVMDRPYSLQRGAVAVTAAPAGSGTLSGGVSGQTGTAGG